MKRYSTIKFKWIETMGEIIALQRKGAFKFLSYPHGTSKQENPFIETHQETMVILSRRRYEERNFCILNNSTYAYPHLWPSKRNIQHNCKSLISCRSKNKTSWTKALRNQFQLPSTNDSQDHFTILRTHAKSSIEKIERQCKVLKENREDDIYIAPRNITTIRPLLMHSLFVSLLKVMILGWYHSWESSPT